MKLEYLYIDGYKGLKRLKLQFKEQTGAVPVDLFLPVLCKMSCRDLFLS